MQENIIINSPLLYNEDRYSIKINADVNASYNIMRLGLDKINVKLDVLEIRPENKRFMLNPVSISII